MKNIDWQGIALVLMVALVFGGFIIENVKKADRFAACEVRGDTMRKIDGEWQCVKEGGK